ncbi:MAG: hypothetical protein M1837_001858 [Sclerophora amabilis]|nr:MAG: hypothetical protein M1837_001858 [Sclerophora amabilis]
MNYQNGYNPSGFGHPQSQQFGPTGGSNPQNYPAQPILSQPQQSQHPQHQHPQQQHPQQQHPQQQHPQHQHPQQQQHPQRHQHQPQQAFAGGQISPPQHQQHQQQHPQYAGSVGMGMGLDLGSAVGMTPGGSAMLPVGGQQHMTGHQSPYSSAPYGHVPLTPTSTGPSSSHQQQHQHQQQQQHQHQQHQHHQQLQQLHQLQQHPLPQQPPSIHQTSLSPQRRVSPHNANQPQQYRPVSNPVSGPPPPSHLSQSVVAPNQSQQSSNHAQQPPLSPGAKEREKERVSLLLLINGELIQEVMKLQTEGKAGMPDQSQKDGSDEKRDADGPMSKPKKSPPHPEFIECMRRLQANLGYLAVIADRSHKPAATIPASPAILVAPEKMPSLTEPYKRLLALFPGAPHVHKSVGGPTKPTGQPPIHFPSNPPASNSTQGTPTSAGKGPPNLTINNPTGATQAEQNYKQWLEEIRRSSPQKESLEKEAKGRISGEPEKQSMPNPSILQQSHFQNAAPPQ